MTRLLSSTAFLIVDFMVLLSVSASSNFAMWGACLLALPLIIWLAGGASARPVLLFILGLCWLQIVGDVIAADILGSPLADDLGSYRETAILYSLSAILAMALGMRCGKHFSKWIFGGSPRRRALAGPIVERPLDMNRLVVAFFASMVFVTGLWIVVRFVPTLAQQVLALALIKYACIYLVAATAIETRRYKGLMVVAAADIATGALTYFANYKDGIFVILIAVASAQRQFSFRVLVGSIAAVAFIFWMSLVWISFKNDYRANMYAMTTEQKMAYIWNKYNDVTEIPYWQSLETLSKRVGYTTFYSEVLAIYNKGAIYQDYEFYKNAILHILSPRVLFPNKAELNDSAKTRSLIGANIAEGTSMGVGYVAEAHVDFGFPGLLVPIWAIGLLLAMAAEYLMTRPAPIRIREAFTAGTLFSCFRFETNIDKSLGLFITGLLVMAVVLKFGYPQIAAWLAGSHRHEYARGVA